MDSQEVGRVDRMVSRWVGLAADGLVPMFDSERQLFCFRMNKTGRGLVREGISRRYTMMCLMGLQRLKESGIASPIEIEPVLDSLLKDLEWVDNIGDLGVLLWTCATVAPERLKGLWTGLAVDRALSRDTGRHTMALAWFLTGLAHWAAVCPAQKSKLEDTAFQTFAVLHNNRGSHAYFGHLTSERSVGGRIRGGIGSFADQVYPIYAMAMFSHVYGEPVAREAALKCARAICDAQGPLGQWWWHYNSSNALVFDGYPVFSVHQHGMAPMTLLTLGEVTNSDFTPWIYRGMRWVNRNNEMEFEMEDASAKLIWRCIYSSSLQFNRKRKVLFNRPNVAKAQQPASKLKVRFECRPYELGWLLYAFAGRRLRQQRQAAELMGVS